MRFALTALLFLAAGCGTVVPYSLAPDILAPELVPEQAASVLVVTDRETARRSALTGRVLDRETNAPLAARVAVGERELTATEAGMFTTPLSGGDVVVRVTLDGYAPAEATVPLADGEQATVLVLLGAAR